MKRFILSALAASLGVVAMAQTVNLTTFADNGYVQSFDSLTTSTTNVALTNGGGEFNNGPTATLPGWYYGTSLGTATQYQIRESTGTQTTGQFYSNGLAAAGDRALGSVGSNATGSLSYGARFKNQTGTSTGLFVVQFDLEEWRAANTTAQGLGLSYKLVKGGGGFVQSEFNLGTGFVTTGIKTQTTTTDDAALINLSAESTNTTIFGPIASNVGALNGNLVANSVRVRTVIQLFANGELFEPGDEIVFRWNDLNDTGNDSALSIDNVEAVPEPASMMAIGLGIAGLAARRRRASK